MVFSRGRARMARRSRNSKPPNLRFNGRQSAVETEGRAKSAITHCRNAKPNPLTNPVTHDHTCSSAVHAKPFNPLVVADRIVSRLDCFQALGIRRYKVGRERERGRCLYPLQEPSRCTTSWLSLRPSPPRRFGSETTAGISFRRRSGRSGRVCWPVITRWSLG